MNLFKNLGVESIYLNPYFFVKNSQIKTIDEIPVPIPRMINAEKEKQYEFV